MDTVLAVFDDEAKVAYAECDNALFLEIEKYSIEFAKMMNDLSYRLPGQIWSISPAAFIRWSPPTRSTKTPSGIVSLRSATSSTPTAASVMLVSGIVADMTPVVICIGGSALDTWTEMTLQRSKDEMTGSLSVTIFAGAMSSGPMVQAAKCGAEITVYIAGQLAFCGTVDKREGSGTKKGKKGADETNQKDGKGTGGTQACRFLSAQTSTPSSCRLAARPSD